MQVISSLGKTPRLCFVFWRLAPAERPGRTQQFEAVFILICDFQPLLDIGNPLQLPAALNVNLLSITIFLFTPVAAAATLTPPPVPPPPPSLVLPRGGGAPAAALMTSSPITR